MTDKGREAFRRIFGWLCDDQAIELVHSLSPRRTSMKIEKVEHPTPESMIENYGQPFELPPLDEPTESVMPTEKINIKSPSSPQKSSNSSSSKTNNRWKHDDISKEKIMDLIENEKAKLLDKVPLFSFVNTVHSKSIY